VQLLLQPVYFRMLECHFHLCNFTNQCTICFENYLSGKQGLVFYPFCTKLLQSFKKKENYMNHICSTGKKQIGEYWMGLIHIFVYSPCDLWKTLILLLDNKAIQDTNRAGFPMDIFSKNNLVKCINKIRRV
jgi:hypothetical protein